MNEQKGLILMKDDHLERADFKKKKSGKKNKLKAIEMKRIERKKLKTERNLEKENTNT
jgi:hypothetical protein